MQEFSKVAYGRKLIDAAREYFGKSLSELSPHELHAVIATTMKTYVLAGNWPQSKTIYSGTRICMYFSIEYLPGRILIDALINTGLLDITHDILSENGVNTNWQEAISDPALGNGGLGRLAACFLESGATTRIPILGTGIYYKFGLFKQQFNSDGYQIAAKDDWTEHGDPWVDVSEEEAVIVSFEDTQVRAVPCYIPIFGYSDDPASSNNVFPLLLWKAEPIEGVTNYSASQISMHLYPNDGDPEGKKLRIRQEYFMASATMQHLFRIHKQKHGTLDNFEDFYAFQMNDTHPVFACLEFIRLLKLEGYSFKEAFEKAKKCFNYTNHTVMPEALEKWPIELFKDILPSIFKVVEELNQELIDELLGKRKFTFTSVQDGKIVKVGKWPEIRKYELFDTKSGIIHMAKIACFISGKINGVAEVHSEIIKDSTLDIWYNLYPERFTNQTNGVTQRRWIRYSNPYLSGFMDKYLGRGWTSDLSVLKHLNSETFLDSPDVLEEFAEAKQAAKQDLLDYIEEQEGVRIPPHFAVFCQIKRIHEYKRQLMNAMGILSIYDQLKNGKLPDFYPTVFIIGGKAADSYDKAKRIIQLIKDIQNMINNDPDVNDKLKVVFLTNFGVKYGEKVYPGATHSLQISPARTEASGTGNMKLMMNGALTIGTLDGANIEIFEEAGEENAYIFGATVDVLNKVEAESSYNPHSFLEAHPELRQLLDYMKGGHRLKHTYWDLVNSLEYNDQYYVIYDLQDYINAVLKANRDYGLEQTTGNRAHYTRKCLVNTATSSKFSSDRTIRGYAEEIWHIKPLTN